MNDETKEIAIEVSKEFVKEAVKPLSELLVPPCKSIGEGIGSIFEIIFSPFKFLNDKVRAAQERFKVKLANKLNEIPDSNVVVPELNKIGPILEASKYYIEDELLSAMFANLLAASCNRDTEKMAHISFIEIIKQLTPYEAKLLVDLAKSDYGIINIIKYVSSDDESYTYVINHFLPTNTLLTDPIDIEIYQTHIHNLIRLSLIEIDSIHYFDEEQLYTDIEQNPTFLNLKEKYGDLLDYQKESWQFTSFGRLFVKICLKS